MTEAERNELAKEWIEIADSNGNGTIDLAEFQELSTKLVTDSSFTKERASQIFSNFNSGTGELTTAEFGGALGEVFSEIQATE